MHFTAPLLSHLLALLAAATTPQGMPDAHAITGVRVVTGAGPVLEDATVLVRRGRIEAVGRDLAVPPDARVMEGKGLTVYPGFLDALARGGTREVEDPPGMEAKGIALYDHENSRWEGARRHGFAAAALAPPGASLRGTSSVVSLTGEPAPGAALRETAAFHASFRRTRGSFPASLMGVMAHLRQTFLDARHQARLLEIHDAHPAALERPRPDPGLAALLPVLEGSRPLVFEAEGENDILRALGLAGEHGFGLWIAGGREAATVLEPLREAGCPVLLTLAFREVADPETETDGDAPEEEGMEREGRRRSQEGTRGARDARSALRLRREDVESVAAVARSGLPFAFSSAGVEDYATLLRNLAIAVEHGGLDRGQALFGLTLGAARLLGLERDLGSVEEGKLASLAVADGDLLAEGTQVVALFVEGRRFDFERPDGEQGARGEAEQAAEGGEAAEGARRPRRRRRGVELVDHDPDPAHPVLAASGRQERPVLLANATLVNPFPLGTTEGAWVLLEEGRIAKVATEEIHAPDAEVVDLTGRYLAPGIVDCHSHMCMEGGVNESTLPVTCALRVADIIRHSDPTVFRALAGGVTAAHLMHGSANPIGGQTAVIKMRWGRSAAEMLVGDAPAGVKMALGENPKRVHGSRSAGPSSRLGVARTIHDALVEGAHYRQSWERYLAAVGASPEGGPPPVPPRRDLRLEALAGIVDGTIRIHAHCYRSDEILMLLELCEGFGIRIATLQHVLEGFKVADEIAAHGAGASTFADHWAFKVESYHSIPHGPALMTQRGVLVSVNSDSGERVRRMNLDAAKAVRYGGLSPGEALALVTLNPARQLGLDHRIGSIEEGKDADVVVWSAHPLSSFARCERTYVDGVLYFDRSRVPTLLDPPGTAAAAVEAAVVDEEEEEEEEEEGR